MCINVLYFSKKNYSLFHVICISTEINYYEIKTNKIVSSPSINPFYKY